MEKWRSKGRSKDERSILPPTKRSSGQNCLPVDKKKDRKWSFGGLLKRISSSQRNESSSNDEDITYIPGHLLAKKQTKRVSKMKSKLRKVARSGIGETEEAVDEDNDDPGRIDATESVASSELKPTRSKDSVCASNDSVNSPSSEGSLDAAGKHRRISRMKARAEAKRDHLRNSSSEDNDDDNSHKSKQSSMKLRHEKDTVIMKQNLHPTDSWSRRTRGARTERYIKRMFRDDSNSEPDDNRGQRKSMISSSQTTIFDLSSNQTNSPGVSSPTGSSSGIVRSRFIDRDRRVFEERPHDSRASNPPTYELNTERECDKFTWPKTNIRRTNPGGDIYGSLRAEQGKVSLDQQMEDRKALPPEPPPRSSKSRIFTNISNPTFSLDRSGTRQASYRSYEPIDRNEGVRSCMSDNEILRDYQMSGVSPTRFQVQTSHPQSANYNSLDRTHRRGAEPEITQREIHGWNSPTGSNLVNPVPFVHQVARSTRSLPKGVELFSRREIPERTDRDKESKVPSRYPVDGKSSNFHPIPRPRTRHEISQPPAVKIRDENEAERKRSSRNLQEALFELEAIYNSLRLSDPDLLDRAEERTMNEYRDNAKNLTYNFSKSNVCSSMSKDDNDFSRADTSRRDTNLRLEDDMAYRRMNPKERPSSVNGQSSLSCISYLATSPNLSNRDEFIPRPRSGRSSPDLTRDDLLFRSISHAMNTLKVIEPQPPFGIPLGPVTGSTESDYLHVKPPTMKQGQTRSLYIPKAEPDVVGDDLAFRNLRKDSSTGINKNTCCYLQTEMTMEPNLKYDTSSLGTRKKRAVRSNTTDLNGFTKNNDWYNEYVRSSQKLTNFSHAEDTMNNYNFVKNATGSSYDPTGRDYRNGYLDINGNQPKIPLQRKIQVYVPPDIPSCDNEIYDNAKFRRDDRTLIITESEEHNDKANIEEFTEQEISEYTQLCRDLEKLIRQTDDETKKEIEQDKADNDSQSEFDEWERLFNEDYEVPSSLMNFNEGLEIPSTEKEDEHSSSRSAGLSKIDKFSGEEELLSSASEVGVGSNSGSLPDSVYEKFDRLLREVNDLPLIEDPAKINEYPINETTTTDLEKVSNLRSTEIDLEPTKTRREVGGTLNDTSQQLEPQISASSKNPSRDRSSTSTLENLKSLTRRMRKEGIGYQNFPTTSQVVNEEPTRTKPSNEETPFFKGTTLPTRLLGPNDDAVSSTQMDEFDKLVDEVLSSSPVDLSICSDNDDSTDSVYDKFNELLMEVNDFPIVAGIGDDPFDNIVINDRTGSDLTPSFIELIDSNLPDDPRENRDRLKRRKAKSEITDEGSPVSILEGKTRLELRTEEVSREGEKNVEDEATREDDAFKETGMHKLRNLCLVTNSVTMQDVVILSFFLTLLITVLFAQ